MEQTKKQIISKLEDIFNYYSLGKPNKKSKIYSKESIGNPSEESKIYSKIRDKASYAFGVPKKYLTRKVKTFGQLTEIILKHFKNPSPAEEDLDLEIEELLNYKTI